MYNWLINSENGGSPFLHTSYMIAAVFYIYKIKSVALISIVEKLQNGTYGVRLTMSRM